MSKPFLIDESCFDYTFPDCQELQDILGLIEQKVADGDDIAGMEQLLLQLPPDACSGPLALQFQPHPSANNLLQMDTPCSDDSLAPPYVAAAAPPAPPQQSHSPPLSPLSLPPPLAHYLSSTGQHQGQYMPAVHSGTAGAPHAGPRSSFTGALGAAYSMGSGTMTYPGLLPSGMQQHSAVPVAAPAASKGNGCDKPQISHSTVEKQRRDRINTLIDELRDLVPSSIPSLGVKGDGGLESRRPKHVVLADTIALLKNMHRAAAANLPAVGGFQQHLDTKPSLGGNMSREPSGGLPPASALGRSPPNTLMHLPARTTSGVKSNGSASDQDDMDGMYGAPQLPRIPMHFNQMAGVSVEKGPDCMYVQVKCRDRRGLLSDIIDALRVLPLEIRTASVTTTADGCVRDVFEVMPDRADMAPEEVQNLVHHALFQPSAVAKRSRC